MFVNTAYEAFYISMGLRLHEGIVSILTHQTIVMAIVLMIFAVMLFRTTVQYFSRYMPDYIIKQSPTALSRFAWVVFYLVLGLAILKVPARTQVYNYKRQPWINNAYLETRQAVSIDGYRVSLVFDLISRTSEEISAFISHSIDRLFKSSNSQLHTPDIGYRAMVAASANVVKSPLLKHGLNLFATSCAPQLMKHDAGAWTSSFIGSRPKEMDAILRSIPLTGELAGATNCLALNNYIDKAVIDEALDEYKKSETVLNALGASTNVKRFLAASAIRNHYGSEYQTSAGVNIKATNPDWFVVLRQTLGGYFKKARGFGRNKSGRVSFNENNTFTDKNQVYHASNRFDARLNQAPHMIGLIKMMLIAGFPFLIFPVVAGGWRVLIYWTAIYFSVLLWQPLWLFLFYVMQSVVGAQAQLQQRLGHSAGAVIGATLMEDDMNFFYQLYYWIQLIIGPVFSFVMIFWLKPFFQGSKESGTDAIKHSKSAAALSGGPIV